MALGGMDGAYLCEPPRAWEIKSQEMRLLRHMALCRQNRVAIMSWLQHSLAYRIGDE